MEYLVFYTKPLQETVHLSCNTRADFLQKLVFYRMSPDFFLTEKSTRYHNIPKTVVLVKKKGGKKEKKKYFISIIVLSCLIPRHWKTVCLHT